MQKVKNWPYLLLLLVISGLFLRLVRLPDFPPGLNWDEASLGYSAYSLLKTGHDEWGSASPLIFRAFGDYKLPSYIYLDVVPVAFLGLNPSGVRLPSVLAGTCLILMSFLLARQIFKDDRIALLTALLVAIEPWSLFLSRVGLEANLAAFLICAGIVFLLRHKITPGLLFLGLYVWTYNSARLFTPLFLLAYWVIRRPKLSTVNYLLLTVFFVPMLLQLFSPSGQARYKWVSLIDQGAINRINELRLNSDLPETLSRIFFNKVSYSLFTFTVNYLKHFSPDFLFFSGGSNYQFNIPGYGLLSLINLPFFYLGLLHLPGFHDRKNRVIFPLLAWLFLAPIPASLTRDAPHTLRAITLLPLPMLISAFGAVKIWDRLKTHLPNYFPIVWLVCLILSLEYYTTTVTPAYRTAYSWSWQYGYRDIVAYVRNHYSEYDRVIVSKRYGEPHIFFLFYWPWDPVAYRTDPDLIRYFKSDWYWVDSFAKFRFVNDWDLVEYVSQPNPGQKYLTVSSPDNAAPGTPLGQINFLDGQPAFIIKEN